MRSTRLCLLSLLAALLCVNLSYGVSPEEITSTLCRSGGGDWTRVVPVVVDNSTDADFVEKIVSIPIADAPNALPFLNERVESIRVADEDGVELTFNVVRADDTFLDKGVVDQPCLLSLPATQSAGSKKTYYIFAGNDKAFPNPDRLGSFRKNASNLDFEVGSGEVPDGWRFDNSDSQGKLLWTDENPDSGKRCVRCSVPDGDKQSWIAARQVGVSIEPGAKYRFEARVRGHNVKGTVGWYLHIGNSQTEMIAAPMLAVNREGDFDWTTVSNEFTVPKDADLLSLGTVLYGTGTAWYDSASLSKIDADGATIDITALGASQEATVGDEQALPVAPSYYPGPDGPTATFDPEKLNIGANKRYATVRIQTNETDDSSLVVLVMSSLETLWGRNLGEGDVDIIGLDGKVVPAEFYQGSAYFEAKLIPNARNYFVVVEKTPAVGKSSATKGETKTANQAFPGTSLQQTNAGGGSDANADYEALKLPSFLLERNLLKDGDFENVDPETFEETSKNPDGAVWTHDDPNEKGVRYSIVDSGIAALGKKSLKVEVSEDAEPRWRGWRRRVKVEPNRGYAIGYAIKCDTSSGSYDLHMHWRKADGELSSGRFAALGKPVGGKTDWSLKSGALRSASDAEYLELHLTNTNSGSVEYDSVFIAPIEYAEPAEFFGGRTGAFQVPAVAKVFTNTTFAESAIPIDEKNPATCALALDEEETLQLALRVDADSTWRVEASEPTLRGSKTVKLATPDVFAVGLVLVDYPTNYYQDKTPKTTRKFPKGSPGCDGWIGYWPDPLIPIELNGGSCSLDPKGAALWNDSQRLASDGANDLLELKQDETRAVWLKFKTTSATKPGVYEGKLTLVDKANSSGKIEIPYTVDVLNFVAPPTKVAGIYDARISADYFGDGSRTEKLRKVADRLLERKLSPDHPVADPVFTYDKATGKFSADFAEYDEQASRYFDELGGKASYFPGEFYLFGWGVPPKVVNGEAPYPGEYPYEGADRSQLRPEYKKVYQAKLKLFWEHLKEKGWADKCVLYISDEPFYSMPEILAQMKALCDMIHEVDPAIPIYASTWVFIPEWLGYIDVWGIGHYGNVGEESLQKIRDFGSRIWWTTDGQMCLDTPLCAVERLLPYTCVKHGAEVYEFWGATWYTCDPFESASHLYISQSDQPGVQYYVRYPNGDGYIFYPGDPIGRPGEILDSIRSEQAREGIEDAGWLVGLQNAIAEKTTPGSPEQKEAQAVLDRALNYLPLQCGSGRYSTRYMADPNEFEQIRLDVGKTLEKLATK